MQYTPTGGGGRPLPPAAWYPDPTGRHEARYWDGTRWTDHVCTRSQIGIDPLLVPAAATATTTVGPSATAGPTETAAATVTAAIGAPPPSAHAPSPPPQARIRSLGGLTTALTLLLSVAVAIGAFSVFAHFNRVSVANDILDFGSGTGSGDGFDLLQRANDADDYVVVAALLSLLVIVAVAVVLIIWMWRVAKNAQVAGRMKPRLGPGWTIGGWFIPFASCVIPVLVMQDLWRGSNPDTPPDDPSWRRRPGSAMVGWWWAAFLLSSATFWFNNDVETRADLEVLRVMDSVAGIASVATIAAAVLLIVVVRAITRRQLELLARAAASGVRPE